MVKLRYSLLLAVTFAGSVSSGSAVAATPTAAPAAPYTTASGQHRSTARFRGHQTLLWLVSTWCTSCAQGIKALAPRAPELRRAKLRVVVLRNYRNSGYPGPGIAQFVKHATPNPVSKVWTLGEASKALEAAYNPRHYPDIYFLIDPAGHIQTISSAPSATLQTILAFAGASRG